MEGRENKLEGDKGEKTKWESDDGIGNADAVERNDVRE